MSYFLQPHSYGPGVELDENGDIKVPQIDQSAQRESPSLNISFTQPVFVDTNIDPALLAESVAVGVSGYAPSEPFQLNKVPLIGPSGSSKRKSILVNRTQKKPRHNPSTSSKEPKKPRKPKPLLMCPELGCGKSCRGKFNLDRHHDFKHKTIEELIAQGKSYKCPGAECETHFRTRWDAERHGESCDKNPQKSSTSETLINVVGPST